MGRKWDVYDNSWIPNKIGHIEEKPSYSGSPGPSPLLWPFIFIITAYVLFHLVLTPIFKKLGTTTGREAENLVALAFYCVAIIPISYLTINKLKQSGKNWVDYILCAMGLIFLFLLIVSVAPPLYRLILS